MKIKYSMKSLAFCQWKQDAVQSCEAEAKVHKFCLTEVLIERYLNFHTHHKNHVKSTSHKDLEYGFKAMSDGVFTY